MVQMAHLIAQRRVVISATSQTSHSIGNISLNKQAQGQATKNLSQNKLMFCFKDFVHCELDVHKFTICVKHVHVAIALE